MEVKHLDWDSDFFGFPVGRLDMDGSDFDGAEVQDVLYASRETAVYLCAASASEHGDKLLARMGAIKYDVRVVYAKTLTVSEAKPGPTHNVEVYHGPLTTDLESLAIESGQYSRFRRDPGFRPHFERLYKRWMRVSVDGTYADRVLVVQTDALISGVLTTQIKEECGAIGLFAVSPRFRDRGIGRKLLEACELWYVREGALLSQIATQKANRPACEWYARRGYEPQHFQHVYHWWRPQDGAQGMARRCGDSVT